MKMKFAVMGALMATIMTVPQIAAAGCVKKAAEATSGTKDSAKWFVMETIVQQVSWGLWPGWVVTGDLPGYTIKNKRFRCKNSGAGVTCYGQATICKN